MLFFTPFVPVNRFGGYTNARRVWHARSDRTACLPHDLVANSGSTLGTREK